MRAVVVDKPGGPEVMRIGEVAPPPLVPGSIRIEIHATAVNRADLLQRRGHYPPPPGASEIIGLECSGVVSEVASGVTQWKRGDRVMALLPGGGYAEECVVDAGSAMRIPESMSFEEAAAIPEVFLTAYLNAFMLGRLAKGERFLVHGGGSGVGTAAIQLARDAAAVVYTTAGDDAKCRRCEALGAARAINYKRESFSDVIAELTSRRGVEVILDHIGGPYLQPNVDSLAMGGRLVLIGTMGGREATIDVGKLLAKRATIIGSTLRARSNEEKGGIVSSFVSAFGEALASKRVAPVIDRVLPLEDVAEAHRVVERSEHFGKVVLRVR